MGYGLLLVDNWKEDSKAVRYATALLRNVAYGYYETARGAYDTEQSSYDNFGSEAFRNEVCGVAKRIVGASFCHVQQH